MQSRRIILNSNVNYFRPIFFNHGQGNLFRSSRTRRPVTITILFLVVTIATYFWGLLRPKQSWLFFFALLLTCTSLIFLGVYLNRFYKWKTQVQDYLKTVSQIKKSALTLSSESFELQINEQIIVQTLRTIKRTVINSDYISIVADEETFLFPAQAMSTDDFSAFSDYLRGTGA